MATKNHGLTSSTLSSTFRAAAFAVLTAALSACAASGITAPDNSAGLDKWDGEPVFMPAESNCAMTPSAPGCVKP